MIPGEDGSEVYQFNSKGRHLLTLDALTGAVKYQFTYDGSGRLVSVTDESGNVTTVERDAAGNPTAIIAPFGQRTTLALEGNGYLESITKPSGESHTMSYTSDGLMLSFADPNGNSSQFTYDAQGLLTKDEDAAGGFKTLIKEVKGAVNYNFLDTALGKRTIYTTEQLSTGDEKRTVTSPSGGVQTRNIGQNGITTTTEPDGTITTTTNGPDPRFGMLVPIQSQQTIQTPGGLTSTIRESRTASLATSGDPLSLTTLTDTTTINSQVYTTVFNAALKEFTSTTPANRISKTTIDMLGKPLTLTPDPTILPIGFTYDSKGKLTETAQGSSKVQFSYDLSGRMSSSTSPLGLTTIYEHDDADRVTKLTQPSSRSYGFAYDANGNRIGITMPSNAVHTLGYNNINLLSSYTPPGNPSYLWEYSLDKELTKTTLPSGREITYSYDASGRSAGASYPEATVSRQYGDTTSRVSKIVRTPSDGGTPQELSFTYDGSLVTGRTFAGVANGKFSYTYDNNFFLTGIKLESDADTVNMPITRDTDGLVTKHGPFTFTHNGPAGATTQITDGTLNVAVAYDSMGRATSRVHTVNSAPIYRIDITYDDASQIVKRIETVNGLATTSEYAYDDDSQLIEVKKNGVVEEEYTYDSNGNRTSYQSSSTGNVNADYDEQDRINQQGGDVYQFDADGFMTSKKGDTFSYSAKGELLSATVAGQDADYAYDGMQRRMARTDQAGTIQYLYGNPGQPFQLTAARDANGDLSVFYYDDSGRLMAFDRGGQRYYVGSDQVGSPRIVTYASGAAIKTLEYHSFGNVTSDSDPGFDLPVGFAGGVDDRNSGLVRFGYRDYDALAGRWTAKDPIFFNGKSANLYQYAKANPITVYDPFGLFGLPPFFDFFREVHLNEEAIVDDLLSEYSEVRESIRHTNEMIEELQRVSERYENAYMNSSMCNPNLRDRIEDIWDAIVSLSINRTEKLHRLNKIIRDLRLYGYDFML